MSLPPIPRAYVYGASEVEAYAKLAVREAFHLLLIEYDRDQFGLTRNFQISDRARHILKDYK